MASRAGRRPISERRRRPAQIGVGVTGACRQLAAAPAQFN